MRIYFTKAYWKLFGMASVILTIMILGIVGYKAFKNRNGEYMTFENDYGGTTLRVTKRKGGFPVPKDFPTDIVELYPDLRLRDVYIVKNKQNEVEEIKVEGYSNDGEEEIKRFYEGENGSKFNEGYEGTVTVSEANTEYTKEENIVSEKTELIIRVNKR